MRRILKLVTTNKVQWRKVAQLGGIALGVSLARQSYRLYCQEEVDLDDSKKHNSKPITKYAQNSHDSDIQIISKYTSVSDLIIHHRTESECIVILPSCSVATRELILKSLKRKRDDKSIRVYVFDPSIQQEEGHNLNPKDEKRELERKADISPKLDNSEFFAINSFGDLRFFKLNSTQQDNVVASNDLLHPNNFKIDFQKAMNFFYPPKIIRDKDFSQLVDSITNLTLESRLVICYVPDEKGVYDTSLPRIHSLETFKEGRVKNVQELERRFRDISYNYVDKNTKFLLIHSQEIAASLSISEDDAGELFLLKKTSKSMNKESNWTFAGNEYIHKRIQSDSILVNNNSTSYEQVIQKALYQNSANYVQMIDVDTELKAFLMSQQEYGSKKFLLYYSAEALEPEYEDKLIQKLIATKKNIQDNEFTIIFTKNPALLKKFFGIIPDRLSDTVRLLDYSKREVTLKKSTADWTIVNLGVENIKVNQEDDDATLYEKKASSALRYKYEGKITRNKLTYFIKQAILNHKEPTCEEMDSTILNVAKTQYLNAGNFEHEILQKDTNELNSDEISLVYFYKPGCPNCTAMGKALEKFQEDLTSVKQDLAVYDSQQKKYFKYDETLLNRYRLDNHARFKSVRVYRYNIYNECKEFPSPSAAPLLFIFTKNNRFKPIQADLLKDRVNINDSEKVSRYLFKKVDLLGI